MRHIEQMIVAGLIRRALAAGYTVSVHDSCDGDGEFTVKRSTNPTEILAALNTTGGDILLFRDANGARVGTVTLIYNGDDTVIADHTANDAIGALTAFAI
jgi:hypothetical protein